MDLTGASETMLLTLHARAEHTLSARPRFTDWAAVDLVGRIDYDFTSAGRDRLMSDGVVLRTLTLDPLVAGYLATHRGATVVNVACGLDTRFNRLDDGAATWYELDLPPVIELRRRLLGEGPRHPLIAASATDPAWPRQVRPESAAGDVLVIVEGLTMYLTATETAQMMSVIARGLPGATVLVEVMSPLFARYGRERSVVGTGSRFSYGCSGAAELCRTVAPGYTALHDIPFTNTIVRYHPWLGPVVRVTPANRIASRMLVVRALRVGGGGVIRRCLVGGGWR